MTTPDPTPDSAPAAKKNAPRGSRVRPVPAVTRSIAILRLLGRMQQPMGVKAIADALGLVPSTCLHILRVLVSEELVNADPQTKRYSLGSGMISLARSVLQGGGFTQLIQPHLDELAARYGVSAMGVEITTKQSVLVLAIAHSEQPFRLHTDVGSQFTAWVSATGRLMAAHSGETWPQLRRRFNQISWDQGPTYEEWKKQVDLARERGWCVDRDNFMSGVTVLAVPVFASVGRLTHTLVVAGLSNQMDVTVVQALAAQLQAAARAVEQRLQSSY